MRTWHERTDLAGCPHVSSAKRVKPTPPNGCDECLRTGSGWVHLRVCLSCGHVGCCDSSPNRHASKHYHTTKHPLAQSYEPGENWVWCFVDEVAM